jgi:glycine hydroxymethyltransferase
MARPPLPRSQWPKVLNKPLAEVDPELHDIIEKEKNRQYKVGGLAVGLWF